MAIIDGDARVKVRRSDRVYNSNARAKVRRSYGDYSYSKATEATATIYSDAMAKPQRLYGAVMLQQSYAAMLGRRYGDYAVMLG